ncbi:sarcosine oxidase subunit delta, partial [bacterium]|nr:sarcosine oxidase subunit delta [bacterium]
CSDAEWGAYLYFRRNPRGRHHEMWYHAAGCRRFFNVVRDTVTYDIEQTYAMGAQPVKDEALLQ